MSSRDPSFRHRTGYAPRSPLASSHFEMDRDWATPKLAQRQQTVDYNGNRIVGNSMLYDRSISQPASPNSHRVRENMSDFNSGGITAHARKQSDATELAELLGIQQEQQLQSMKWSPNALSQRKWSSCSNLDQESYPSVITGFGPHNLTASLQYYGGYSYHAPVTNTHSVPTATTTASFMNSLREGAELIAPVTSSGDEFVTPPKRRSKSPNLAPEDPDRWNSILVAKDELIRQKDEIIDRQKKTLTQLQHQQVDMDSKLQLALMTQSPDLGSDVLMKVQECQYENKKLRALLSQVTREKDKEVIKLTQKLGETEYQLQQMAANVEEAASKTEWELGLKITHKDKLLKETAEQLEETKEHLLNAKRDNQTMKNYINNKLTDVEEIQLRQQREENRLLKKSQESKDKRIAQLNKALSKKTQEAKTLTAENSRLQGKVEGLEAAASKYRIKRPGTEIEFDMLKMECETLEQGLEQTKKLLTAEQEERKAVDQEAQKTQQVLKTRLAQEEDAVKALQKELENKENTIKKLNASIQQERARVQDLLSENMDYKDTCEKLKEENFQEHIKQREDLWKQLLSCIEELKDVVQICVARKNGKEPVMEDLLGISSGSRTQLNWETDSSEDMQKRAEEIKAVRDDVDSIRTFVRDQYAEDVGRNCSMQ